MLEFFNTIDTKLFLFLNQLHHPLLDGVMLTVSYNKYLFLFLLILLSIYGFIKLKHLYLIAFVFCAISFGLSDSISTRVFKENIKRLRPCHEPALRSQVHLAGQRCWGGKYGFVSSHAANSFAIAMFFWLLFRKQSKWFGLLFVYAGLISYSRIYLAKHYPGDILGGAILGMLIAYGVFKLYAKTTSSLKLPPTYQQ